MKRRNIYIAAFVISRLVDAGLILTSFLIGQPALSLFWVLFMIDPVMAWLDLIKATPRHEQGL